MTTNHLTSTKTTNRNNPQTTGETSKGDGMVDGDQSGSREISQAVDHENIFNINTSSDDRKETSLPSSTSTETPRSRRSNGGVPKHIYIPTSSSSSPRSLDSSSHSAKKISRSSDEQPPSFHTDNDGGRKFLNSSWTSVLSHEDSLKLFCAMHGVNLPDQILQDERQILQDDRKYEFMVDELNFDDNPDYGNEMFEEVIKGTWKNGEASVTKRICQDITAKYNGHLHAAGEVKVYSRDFVLYRGKEVALHHCDRMDIVISKSQQDYEDKTTPLAIVEMGLKNDKWWQKFHQNGVYVNNLSEFRHEDVSSEMASKYSKDQMKFDEPMLFGVLTFERIGELQSVSTPNNAVSTPNNPVSTPSFISKFGVFLCIPGKGSSKFKMCMLWNQLSNDLSQSSERFGRFLRVVHWFSKHTRNLSALSLSPSPSPYTYLSSCCCKIGNRVYRVYDGRFRKTYRSPQIYLSQAGQELTGKVETVIRLDTTGGDVGFWSQRSIRAAADVMETTDDVPNERDLLIISVPYKEGIHYATKPRDFVPLVTQVQELHKADFVHGDIRAFNTIFPGESTGNNSQGGLIDFDFGGEAGTVTYPPGYKDSLADGRRLGIDGELITKYHDWYAVGKLIFDIHRFKRNLDDKPSSETRDRVEDMNDEWTNLESENGDVDEAKIRKLLAFLKDGEINKSYILERDLRFKALLPKDEDEGLEIRNEAVATGSPPKASVKFQSDDKRYLSSLKDDNESWKSSDY